MTNDLAVLHADFIRARRNRIALIEATPTKNATPEQLKQLQDAADADYEAWCRYSRIANHGWTG